MPDSVYKVIDLIGSSPNSWEEAVKNAVEKASKSLKDLRVAEVKELDVKLEDGKVVAYRAKVSVSFKLEGKVVIDFYA
jgi:flavin-binding protein dodecin